MSSLLVQLYGIGNLVQTEPLMRYLGGGDILVDPKRSTDQMAPLFPNWKFCTQESWEGKTFSPGRYDDVYLCGPWIKPQEYGLIAKRVHTSTWTFQGPWEHTEAYALAEMVSGVVPLSFDECPPTREEITPKLPRLEGWPAPWSHPYVVVSCGYNRHELGWEFKDWGRNGFKEITQRLNGVGVGVVLLGAQEEWEYVGGPGWEKLGKPCNVRNGSLDSLMDQAKFASGCCGYIGNDTGWAHICGAYGLPSAIYIGDPARQDPVKNRTAAPDLLQFYDQMEPETVVRWLLPKVKEKSGWDEMNTPVCC